MSSYQLKMNVWELFFFYVTIFSLSDLMVIAIKTVENTTKSNNETSAHDCANVTLELTMIAS